MHVAEAWVLAIHYHRVEAFPDFPAAMLCPLNVIMSYGHEIILLTEDWRLLCALECMKGVIIFGLCTAILFNAMREPKSVRQSH